MEDQQKQLAEQTVGRRRRAVRAVPMPAARTHTDDAAPQNAEACPMPEKQTDRSQTAAAPPVTEPDRDPGSAAVPQTDGQALPETDDVFAEALNRAFYTEQITRAESSPAAHAAAATSRMTETAAAIGTDVPPKETADDGRVSFAGTAEEAVLERDADPMGADATDTGKSEPAVPRSLHPRWLAVGVVVALLAVSFALGIPFFARSEAVMLYVGDTAIGYLEQEKDAAVQMERLLADIDGTALASSDAVQYRCESEQVRGTVAYLSSDAVYDAMLAHAADGYVRAYRLVTDESDVTPTGSAEGGTGVGPMIGIMTEAELLSAIDAAAAVCCERYAEGLPDGTLISVEPNFTWEAAWVAEEAILDEGSAVSVILGLQDTEGALLDITAALTETVAERIPYETTLVPNDENYDGIRSMISPGSDGLARVTYTVMLDPVTGDEISREETLRTVVWEPVAAVAYEGLYPLPDGVSTGTFDWPLPDLPDDEMPTDENGNPAPPENPLALKNTYISSGYGDRILWGEYDFHLGLDIVAPVYTEIYAADGGVVVYAAYTSSYGYMTRIRHAGNVETVYAHQYKQTVKVGDVVEKGQLIGYVGSTGSSSGAHLHLEFRRDHVTVDPLEYIAIPEEILVLGEGY